MVYSEKRTITGWSAQLTPEAPHQASEGDGDQVVRSMSGDRVRLRRVRRVPDHLTGASIASIRATLFAEAVA